MSLLAAHNRAPEDTTVWEDRDVRLTGAFLHELGQALFRVGSTRHRCSGSEIVFQSRFLALQNARQPSELRAALERWLEIAREAFEAPSGLAAAVAVIHYLLEGTEVGHTWARDYFHKLGSGAQEAFMTGAEALRNEGRVEGGAQIVLRQLSRKFGELPPQVTQRVREASSDELERWAEQLLTAERLEEVFKA